MSTYYAEQEAKLPFGVDLFNLITATTNPSGLSQVIAPPLGARLRLADGRIFRWGLSNDTILIGQVVQMAIPVANHLNCQCDVGRSVGDQLISATLGATAAAANLYQDGYVHVNAPLASAGGGQMFKIKNHAAVLSAGILTANLYDKIRVATTTSSYLTFTKNPGDSVIIAPTTLSAPVFGVSIQAVASGSYGWFQVKGPASVRITGTVGIGQWVMPDNATTAGTCIPAPAGASEVNVPVIGRTMRVNATATYALIDLCIE